MIRTLKALWLGGVLFVVQSLTMSIFAQNPIYTEWEGVWEFEKAEYLEKDSPQGIYIVKQTLTDASELNALDNDYHYLVKMLTVESELAEVVCPSRIYTGKYQISELTSGNESYFLLTIGSIEEENLDYYGRILNAMGLHYRLDKWGDNQIAITREGVIHEGSGVIHGAVRCILKKSN